jgi:hypothetical protein
MDATHTLRALTDAAERFVNKAPNQKRLERERAALLDAILQAQLFLSVENRGSQEGRRPSASGRAKRRPLRLEK